MMNVVFYRYGSIYEPDMLDAFKKAGLNVYEVTHEISDKSVTNSDRVRDLEDNINRYDPMFVYGINYYPALAKLCNIHGVLYITQTVDSPVLTLFSDTIRLNTNRIFMFDREQYNYFSRFSPDTVFHLPLASAVGRFDKVISTINDDDRRKFGCDISFVGSTYREKDPYADISNLSDYTKGYVDALVDSCLKIYGYYPVRDAITERIISDFKQAAGQDFPTADEIVTSSDAYVISHEYIGSHIAVIERERTLNTLARHFNVELFTRSDTSSLKNVHIHEGVRTLDEMPKIFNLSKINLNMTMRPIESGLPLRCFDILGCGGFLMTNYQPEIEDMFIIGEDLEVYSSLDELTDKCAYYLEHEDERMRIARNGYEKVSSKYTHYHRMSEMLSSILS
ncbi:MAG: glycosyltransferase [Lachnospiraceae bacterium]|nr:glycosyltransferase [Lachnospiraceae bacterium]